MIGRKSPTGGSRVGGYAAAAIAVASFFAAPQGTRAQVADSARAEPARAFPDPALQPGETRGGRALRLARADTLCKENRLLLEPTDGSLIFKTGSPTGSYQAVGCAIAKVVERARRQRVILVNGGGSGDNLAALANGDVDLIIAQGDIAHHVYTGEPPDSTGGWRLLGDVVRGIRRRVEGAPGLRIRAVMGLHYEQVMALGSDQLESVSDIDSTMKVAVGSEKSGTIGNAIEVLHVLRVRPDTMMESSRQALSRLGSGVDIVFLTGAWDSVLRDTLRAHRAKVLPISEDVRGHLEEDHSYYRDDATHQTVRIRALLLTRADMPSEVVSEVLEAIHRDIGTEASLVHRSHEAADRDILDDTTLTRDVSVPIHKAAADIFCKEEGTACAYTGAFQLMASSAVLLIVVGSLVFGIAFLGPMRRPFLRLFPKVAHAFGPDGAVSTWRWLLIPVFALVVVLSGTVLVSFIEVVHSLGSGSTSAFTNRNFPGSLVWMLVFAASGYEQQTFPTSTLGQIVSALTVVVAIGGVLFLVGVVTSDGFARRMRMDLRDDLSTLSNHIIVCGWNQRAAALVRTLCAPNEADRHLKIAIVADLDADPTEELELPERKAVHVRGSPMKLPNLEKAGLARADTVIVLADESAATDDRDARTLLTASLVEKYVHRLVAAGERPDDIHTVAELVDPGNREVFEAAFIDQILCAREFDEHLLAQSVLNPGLAHFMEEILVDDEHNEIYEVPVRDGESRRWVGLTFDAALEVGRRDGFLLLAIHRSRTKGGASANGEGQVGGHSNGGGGLITNPSKPEDRAYAIRAGDSLMLLAPDRRSLEAVFGDASGWRSALIRA